ncbi:unnamed protein product [Ixodes pacificus]
MNMLRPGYKPPSRHLVRNALLDEVYREEKAKACLQLYNKGDSMNIDGGSNVHNEQVICVNVTDETGQTFLVDTIDTTAHSHTSDYLSELATNTLKTVKTKTNAR